MPTAQAHQQQLETRSVFAHEGRSPSQISTKFPLMSCTPSHFMSVEDWKRLNRNTSREWSMRSVKRSRLAGYKTVGVVVLKAQNGSMDTLQSVDNASACKT